MKLIGLLNLWPPFGGIAIPTPLPPVFGGWFSLPIETTGDPFQVDPNGSQPIAASTPLGVFVSFPIQTTGDPFAVDPFGAKPLN